ncbi:MAG: 3-oxoacyl-ACP reductase FabG [Candidatus Bipolaricaulota bacterium]|nr:MAG: 3-oxoacyl-ACP reductase FabG [Candidatus Bipolaricaulota bacterium]
MAELTGRVAVVTGGTRGIGRAIVERLVAEGASVWVLARSVDAGRALEGALPGTSFLATDVSDPDEVTAAAKEITRVAGRVDLLVCNAGITRDDLLLRMSDDDWNDVLDVNLKGAFHCLRAFLRPISKSDAGAVLCIGSVVGTMGNAGQANYAASKAGLVGLVRSAAKEYAGRGVRINVLAPGFIETEMTEVLPEEVREPLLARIPLGRVGSAEEVASVAVFLLSPRASYITGQVVAVNGGLHP